MVEGGRGPAVPAVSGERKRVRVVVTGRVQGVFFRAECAERARARGLGGFVRNLPDGRVEAAFEGDPQAVEFMVDWCRRGPRLARVDAVEVTEEPPAGEREFRIAY
jgi:acylphosphatase